MKDKKTLTLLGRPEPSNLFYAEQALGKVMAERHSLNRARKDTRELFYQLGVLFMHLSMQDKQMES